MTSYRGLFVGELYQIDSNVVFESSYDQMLSSVIFLPRMTHIFLEWHKFVVWCEHKHDLELFNDIRAKLYYSTISRRLK